MNYGKSDPIKKYYTAGEIARKCDISIGQLNRLEKIFSQIRPRKVRGRQRHFLERDLVWVEHLCEELAKGKKLPELEDLYKGMSDQELQEYKSESQIQTSNETTENLDYPINKGAARFIRAELEQIRSILVSPKN